MTLLCLGVCRWRCVRGQWNTELEALEFHVRFLQKDRFLTLPRDQILFLFFSVQEMIVLALWRAVWSDSIPYFFHKLHGVLAN